MIIAMTAYNRPEYLGPVLDSLEIAAANIKEPTTLVVNVDPSDVLAEVTGLLGGVVGLDVQVEVNPERLNLQANTYRSNARAWTLDEDYVLGLPDDILVAPDALRCAAWLRDYWRDEPDVLYTGLFSSAPEMIENWHHRTALSYHFGCQAWGCWRSTWEKEWKPRWNHDNPISWDQNVNDHVMQGRLQALPWLSRVRHIGAHGTHATPETFITDSPKHYAGDYLIADGEFWLGPVPGTRWE